MLVSVDDAGPLDSFEELAAALPAKVTAEEAAQLIEQAGIPLRATMGV